MSEIGKVEITPSGVKQSLVYESDAGLKVYEVLAYGICEGGKETQVNPGHHYVAVEPPVEGAEFPMQWTTSFQDGPIPANGVNGLTSEAMLAILIHRTSTLNTNFPCEENELAILHMKKALDWFNTRTAKRKARGVEGKNVV